MTSNMAYQLQLNLQQRATLSAAIAIWNNQKVKDKISKWSSKRRRSEFSKCKPDWQQLMKIVLKKIDLDVLPPKLKGELIHVVKALGEKIYYWYIYIWNSREEVKSPDKDDTIKYIDRIYWTPIGNIDEVRMLQSYCLNNWHHSVPILYSIACNNALERYIDDLWQQMSCDTQDCCSMLSKIFNHFNIRPDPCYDHAILAYWKCRRDNQISHFKKHAVSNHLSRYELEEIGYNQNYSVELNMFLLSVNRYRSNAVKYFWKNLTQEEKDNNILHSAYTTLIHSNNAYAWGSEVSCIRQQYIEIFIFLINEMTVDQKELFFSGKAVLEKVKDYRVYMKNVQREIFSMLLSTWPWQELFIPVLNNMLQYLEHDSEPILEALFQISKKMVEPSCAEENIKYRSILREAWTIIPGSMKRTMVQNNLDLHIYTNFIDDLLKIGDLDSIKMIFNDPEITDVRKQYIKLGEGGYKFLIESNKYELLDQFMEEVLRSEEEKIYCKSLINHINMCQHFIKIEEYDSADKFLNWQFKMVKERKQCKDHFENHKFFIDWIWNILKLCEGNVDKAKKKSFKFLEWMLESKDDIVRFKKEFILRSEPLIEQKVYYGSHKLTQEEAKKIRQILT